MAKPTKDFFDHARGALFSGRLTAGQVDGMNRMVEYALRNDYSRPDTAYVLATAYWETARWMQPIREGARRYGTKYTDAQSRRAVASIHAKGIISRNYALPDGPHGQSYYGRGLVQITWYDNYLKFENLLGIPLTKNPDLALEWPAALDIMFIGMRDGMFRKASLDAVPDVMTKPAFDAEYRNIINGDVRKYGEKIAGFADEFFVALETTFAQEGGTDEPCKCTC